MSSHSTHTKHETRTQREDSNVISTEWNALTDIMNKRFQQLFNSEWSSLSQNRFWVQIDCIHSTQLGYVIYLMSQVIKMSRQIVKSVFWYSVFEFEFLNLRGWISTKLEILSINFLIIFKNENKNAGITALCYCTSMTANQNSHHINLTEAKQPLHMSICHISHFQKLVRCEKALIFRSVCVISYKLNVKLLTRAKNQQTAKN